MSTLWFFPNNVIQSGEIIQHVAWKGESEGFAAIKRAGSDFLVVEKDLLHISNPTTHDIKMKTYYLYLSDFRMTDLPGTIAGIEVAVNMKRGGRITDDTIQLRYNNDFIGLNKATASLENEKIYGGSLDLWDVEVPLTPEMLSDISFGVGLRFQSHPMWPHRESPMINHVKIRIW